MLLGMIKKISQSNNSDPGKGPLAYLNDCLESYAPILLRLDLAGLIVTYYPKEGPDHYLANNSVPEILEESGLLPEISTMGTLVGD